MHLFRYILPVIICLLSSKFAISKDYDGKTTIRMDGREKRGSEEQYQAKGMLERHKQLARLFTALHLQTRFTEDNLTAGDVLAGIWDFKNGAVIDGLIQLNPDGIVQELESVMPNVSRIVTNDEKILSDLKDVSEQFQSVKSSVIDNWNKYQISEKPSKPYGFAPGALHFRLSYNMAKSILKQVSTPDPYLDLVKWGLIDCIEILKGSLIQSFLKIDEHNLEPLVKSMALISPICTKSRELINISELLTASKDYISNIASSSFNISDMKYIKSEDKVWSVLQEDRRSIMDSKMLLEQKMDYDLSNLDEDLQNSNWLKDVLKETEIAEKLNMHGSFFNKLDDEFNQFSSNFRSLHHDFVDVFILISNLQKTDTSFAGKSAMTGNCFNVKYFNEDNKIFPTDQFSEQFSGLKRDFKRILKASQEFPDKANVILELEAYVDVLKNNETSWMENYKRKTQSLLEKLEPSFDSLVMHNSSFRISNLLKMVEDTDEWRNKVTLFKDECKSAFDFDASQLQLIRKVSIAYFEIQKRDLVSKFKKLMESVPTMGKLLNNVRETVENIKREEELLPKNANKPKFTNRENLLKFSSAVYCLEQVRKIDELDAELGIFIEKGDEVVESMKTTKSKNELEKIWGDWPEVKVDLMRFRKSVTKMMLQIRDIPEKNLERMGQVYFWISAARLQGSFDLRKYRESLILLDQNPAPELEQALQKLEVPMSMDWDSVHMNFAKMPEVMRELQKDFDCFFDEKKCPKKESEEKDPSTIANLKYREYERNYYNINLTKVLLGLCLSWITTCCPPFLLLMVWFWIIGIFNKHYGHLLDVSDYYYDSETDSETDDSDSYDSDSDDGYTSTDSNESNTDYYWA